MQGQGQLPDLALTVDGRARFRVLRFSRLHGPPTSVLFARVGFQVGVELAYLAGSPNPQVHWVAYVPLFPSPSSLRLE
jgi:hypothetical protein